ncbi:MAG: carbohydrate binding domain-containing protein [Kangiella sp.]|nr:carbohydrate binding domain-containing protein [Kangiella sp.]
MRPIKYQHRYAFFLFLSLLFLALFLMVAPEVSHSKTSNLPLVNELKNPGFEEDSVFGGVANWKDNSYADQDVNYSIDTSNAYEGRSQKIECTRYKSGAIQFVQNNVRVQRKHSYKIKIWLKGNVKSPVVISLRKKGSPYTTYITKSFNISSKWKEYTFKGISNVDDSNAYFIIKFQGTGTLWADNASLTDVTGVGEKSHNNKGNLIPNGSFEVGLDRWGVQIRELDPVNEMPINLKNVHPYLDSNVSKLGSKSLVLDLPEASQSIITSTYFTVNAGESHTLSFWMKSDRKMHVKAGIAGGNFGNTVGGKHWNIEVFQDWKRYTFTPKIVQVPDDAYHLIFNIRGAGKIWLDGVQLKEGGYRAYQAKGIVEVGLLDTNKNHNAIYHKDDSVKLRALINSSINGTAELTVNSVDYYGNTLPLFKGKIALKQDENKSIDINHPSNKYGYYRIVAITKYNSNLTDTSEIAIGVVRKENNSNIINSPFGNHVYFNKRSLETARKLGVKWIRMHPPSGTKWFIAEREKGKFIFFDEAVKMAKDYGFNILGSLDTTPRWASSAPDSLRDKGHKGFRSYPPEDIKDWENYVRKMVAHYSGVIDYWEVWNEPDSNHFFNIEGDDSLNSKADAYVRLLKSAYKTAKKANPNAIIVGGCSTTKPPKQWPEKILSRGAYDSMDILSFHLYRGDRPHDTFDVPTSVYIDEYRSLMMKYGGDTKPIWLSETGILYPESNFNNIKEVSSQLTVPATDAAKILVRDYIYLLANGVSKWFYYHMNSSHRSDRRGGTGFFEWDDSPRPLAIAYSTLASIMKDGEYIKRLNLGDNLSAYEFKDKDRIIYIVWMTDWTKDNEQTITLPNPASHPFISVYDIMGNKTSERHNANEINLSIGREPTYIVFR